MDKNEIINRLERLARCAIHTEGELPFVMSLDDGIAIHEAIDMLRQSQQEPPWIPCSERLPEDGTWNIFSDGKNVSVERYKMDALDHFFPQGRWFSFDKAIAWMPLPEPYAERRTDDLG